MIQSAYLGQEEGEAAAEAAELPKTAPTSPEDVFRPAPTFTIAKGAAIGGLAIAVLASGWMALRG